MKRILFAAIAMLALPFYSTASQALVTSLTVDNATLSKSTGAITVTGTIVCTAGDVFSVGTDIQQVSGGKNGFTFGESSLDSCSGGVDTWAAPNELIFGSIKNGNAQVVVNAFDVIDNAFINQVFKLPVAPVP
jgi:hypothetical protein